MDVLITGTGDAFSSRHHGSSSLVRGPGGWIAIDCPGGVLRAWREASEVSGCLVDPFEVKDIILTHLHGDHCGGLETIGFMFRYMYPGSKGEPGPRPRLHALPEVLERTWERLAAAMDGSRGTSEAVHGLETYFEPHALAEGGEVDVAGCRVKARRTSHGIPTAALLVAGPDGCLGWSSDTEFDSELVTWLSESDCIVHECGEGPKHTTSEELSMLPEEVRSRMRLMHRPDTAPPIGHGLSLLGEGELLCIKSGT